MQDVLRVALTACGSPRHIRSTHKACVRLQVICNSRAVKQEDGSYQTQGGERLEGDRVYMTVGGKPNTSFLRRSSSIPIDDKDRIQVGALAFSGFLYILGGVMC